MGDEKRILFAFGLLLIIAASQANTSQNSLRTVALQLPSSTWRHYLSTLYPGNYIPVNTLPTCSCMRTGNAPTIYEPIARPPTVGTVGFEGLSTLASIRASQAAVCGPCTSASDSLPCSVYNTQFEAADCSGSSNLFPVPTASTCPLSLEEVQNGACLGTSMQTLSTYTSPREELNKCVGSGYMIAQPTTPSTCLYPAEERKTCVSPGVSMQITTASTCPSPVEEVNYSFDSDTPVPAESTCHLPLEEVPNCISSDITTTSLTSCSLPQQDGTNCVSSGIPDSVPTLSTCQLSPQDVTNSIASDINIPVSPYCLEDDTNGFSSDITLPMSSPMLSEMSDSSACGSYPLFPVDLTAPPEMNTYNFSINGTIYQGINSVPSCNYSDVNYCPETKYCEAFPLSTNINFTNSSITSPENFRMYPSVNPVSIPNSYICTQPLSNTELAVNPCTLNQCPNNISAFTAPINPFNTSCLSPPKTLSPSLAKLYILSIAALHRHQNNLDNTLLPFPYNSPPQVPLITKDTINYRSASSPVCFDKFSSIAENKANKNSPIWTTYQVPRSTEACDNLNTCSCGATTSGLPCNCNFRSPSNLPVINLNCLSKSNSDLSRLLSSIPLFSYFNAATNPYRSTSTEYNPSISKAQSSSCESCAHSLQNACPKISIPPYLVSTQCSLPLCRPYSVSGCSNSMTSTSTSEYRASSLPNTYAPILPAALPSIRNTHSTLSRHQVPSVSQFCSSFIQNDCKGPLTPGNLRADYSSSKQCTSSTTSSNVANALDYGFTSISPNSCELTPASSNLVGAQCSSNYGTPSASPVCVSSSNTYGTCPLSSNFPIMSSNVCSNNSPETLMCSNNQSPIYCNTNLNQRQGEKLSPLCTCNTLNKPLTSYSATNSVADCVSGISSLCNPGMNTVCNSIKNTCPCTSNSLPLNPSSITINPVCNLNNNCNNCNENLGPCTNSPLASCNPAVSLNSNCAPDNSYSCTSTSPLAPPNYAVSPDCNCVPENSRSCTGTLTSSPLTPPNPTNNPPFNCIANSPLMTFNSATMPACNCAPGSPCPCTPSTLPNVANNCQTTNINPSPILTDNLCIISSSPSPSVWSPTTNFNTTARQVLHMPIKTVCTSHIRPLNTTQSLPKIKPIQLVPNIYAIPGPRVKSPSPPAVNTWEDNVTVSPMQKAMGPSHILGPLNSTQCTNSSPTIKPIQLVPNIYAIPGPLVKSPLQAAVNTRADNGTVPPMPSTYPPNVVSPAPVYEITS